MNRLILIESSATLRHAAKTLAQSAGFHVTTIGNYSEGMKKFVELKEKGELDGVVLGWPVKTDNFADELFTALMETEHNEIGVIVLSHIAETNERSWATKRSNTAMVLWDEYEEFVEALKSLGCQSTTAKISEISMTRQEDDIRVLFVDDSPTIRVSYRRLLKDNGYVVETASCVSEAMEKALENTYDIVITDYYMPDGTGDSLCAKLRKNPITENITSAIITGTYSDKAIISSLSAGAVECMFKNEPKELFLARLHAMSRSIIAMRSIKKDHQHLQGILSTVGEGVYGVSCDGIITFINPAAKNILGFTDEEQFIGKSAHDLFHNTQVDGGLNTLEECNLQNAYKTGKKLQSWATSFCHNNGKNISVECTVFPLYHDSELEGSVIAFRDVTERRLLLEELKWQATHDQLTKLPNRSYFEQQLIQEVNRLKRSTENSALLYIDLDRFKYINDTAGHMVGDKLLIDVGNQFRSRLRDADTLARLGGDEFAVIMRNVNEKDAYAAADNFRHVLEDYEFVHAGKMYKVHASIGIAYITAESRASGEVLANADIACYIAKSRGRNTTHFFHGDNDEISTMDIELGWSSRLHDALKNDKFELFYQPILSLADVDFDALPEEDGKLWDSLLETQNVDNLHYEVLLRLPDSRGNKILPDVFLPTAERFNMMKDIDKWVIKHALANLAEHSITGKSITLTINLSGQSLEDLSLSSYITRLIDTYKIDATKVVFEITETSAIANLDTADRFMNELRECGCRFALDDFGSGFCSFSHLKYLSVDIIKIDGVFIQGMMNDAVDRAIVESIAQIARSVNKVTVAEFVENVSLLRALRDIGVDYIQGFYVSPPKESSVFPELSFDREPVEASIIEDEEPVQQVINSGIELPIVTGVNESNVTKSEMGKVEVPLTADNDNQFFTGTTILEAAEKLERDYSVANENMDAGDDNEAPTEEIESLEMSAEEIEFHQLLAASKQNETEEKFVTQQQNSFDVVNDLPETAEDLAETTMVENVEEIELSQSNINQDTESTTVEVFDLSDSDIQITETLAELSEEIEFGESTHEFDEKIMLAESEYDSIENAHLSESATLIDIDFESENTVTDAATVDNNKSFEAQWTQTDLPLAEPLVDNKLINGDLDDSDHGSKQSNESGLDADDDIGSVSQ